MSETPWLSVVIPVFNEEDNLPLLHPRLLNVLTNFGRPFEIIYSNDGSADRSRDILARLQAERPDVVVVVDLHRNFGQHAAIIAGFAEARGQVVVTLDADLQNPPEEIPKLVRAIDQGHDVVGSYRRARQDATWRHWASRTINFIRARTTRIDMRDHGCMLRAYRREIVQEIVKAGESSTYIPALAQYFAARPVEVEVEHAQRAAGESKYNLYKLIRLNFDLMTGFSLLPLQIFTLVGMAVSGMSALLVLVLAVRRLVVGPEAEGVFTLFGILFFLLGVVITGLGIIGEYVGRIFQEVRRRPGYIVRQVLRGPPVSTDLTDRGQPYRPASPRGGGVVLFAYSDVGCEALDFLLRQGERVLCVFTHDDDPGEQRWFRSVADLAASAGVRVVRSDRVDLANWQQALGDAQPDFILSAYYRRMIPTAVLNLARLGALNLHGSLLPRYRGRAPVNWAILHGETETGITLHYMTGRADAGDIVDQQAVPIGPDDTAIEVMGRVTQVVKTVLERQWPALKAGRAPRRAQDETLASKFGGRKPDDGCIDWSRPAAEIHNLVRAVTHPYPGAFTESNGAKLYIWRSRPVAGAVGAVPGTVVALDPPRIATGHGDLELISWQWAGAPVWQAGQPSGLALDQQFV